MTSQPLTGHKLYTAEGTFRIGNPLQISNDTAIYETEYGESGQPVLIELRRFDTPDSGEILTSWREALALSHPHLIRMYAAGTSELEGVPVMYRVTENADESLAGVLAERTLSERETREMVEPALSALGYLHNSGYVHGGLEPSAILAVGETLKLSISRVARAGPFGVPADDMKALGTVLTQALIGHVPGDVPQVAAEPWYRLVRHLLDPDPQRRWTADQAIAYLQSPQKAVPEKPVASRERPNRDYRKWILGAIAALLLLIAIGAAITRKTQPANPGSVPPVPVVSAPAPIPEVSRPPVPEKVPEAALISPPAPVVKKTIARSGDRRAEGWAVVVAAYGTRQPAEKRSRELAKKWPAFTFEVIEPASERARDLIVIGSNLSEENADALQKRAIASGVAPDAYIKRFAIDAK